MKKLISSLALAAILIGGSVGLASAQPGQFGPQQHCNWEHFEHKGFKKNHFRLFKELNLSQSQIEQIRALRKEQWKTFAQNRNNFKNPMFEAMKSGNFDANTFVSDSVQNAQQMAQAKAQYMEKFFAILTPQQRQKFVQLMSDRIKNNIRYMEFMQKSLSSRIEHMKSMLNEQ
ncbi:MAG: Spy/CpxP family protein refolding chaperone [Candidatus Micrarchaeaceae archaeon]